MENKWTIGELTLVNIIKTPEWREAIFKVLDKNYIGDISNPNDKPDSDVHHNEVIDILEALIQPEIAELTRKGEELCCAYGNALIEIANLKRGMQPEIDKALREAIEKIVCPHRMNFPNRHCGTCGHVEPCYTRCDNPQIQQLNSLIQPKPLVTLELREAIAMWTLHSNSVYMGELPAQCYRYADELFALIQPEIDQAFERGYKQAADASKALIKTLRQALSGGE